MDPKSKKKEISPEDILQEMEKVRNEIQTARQRSWEDTLPVLNKILDDTAFTQDPAQRATYLTFLQKIWFSGYHSGSTNMATMVARDLGMGAMVDMIQIAKQQVTTDPTRNWNERKSRKTNAALV